MLTVELSGFKKKVLDDVKIIAEQANALNVQLELGQTSEVVTVGAAAPLIDTATGNISGTVTAEQIQSMPSFGRDPMQLLQLAPGAFGDGARGAGGGTQNLPATTIGGSGANTGIFATENGGQIVANGARTGENNYQIDGVGITSVSWGGTTVITPNEDSIKEIKVVTNNYDAENGRYRGAQVQMISQNGTNQLRGSAFFKWDRPSLNAFQKYNGYGKSVTKNTSDFNDFGGTVGGPILKDKLFGFFSYETLRQPTSTTIVQGWYQTPQYMALAAPGGSAAEKFLTFPGSSPTAGHRAHGRGRWPQLRRHRPARRHELPLHPGAGARHRAAAHAPARRARSIVRRAVLSWARRRRDRQPRESRRHSRSPLARDRQFVEEYSGPVQLPRRLQRHVEGPARVQYVSRPAEQRFHQRLHPRDERLSSHAGQRGRDDSLEPRILGLASERSARERGGLALARSGQQSRRAVGASQRLHPGRGRQQHDRHHPAEQPSRLRHRRARLVRPVDVRLQGHADEGGQEPHDQDGRRAHADAVRRHLPVVGAAVLLLQQHVGFSK